MPAVLEAFLPSPEDPWDAAKAAHLLRRAGFGAPPPEISAAAAAGPERAVDALFAFPSEPEPPAIFDEVTMAEEQLDDARERLPRGEANPREHPELRPLFQAVGRAHARAIVDLTAWWLDRMAHGPAPLQEKLTLFWHGHFTSSFADVHDAVAMFNQNQLFRRHAAGNFATLLDGVARDPAMLLYLNNAENRQGRPNENWARELMELFTLGIGHYSETDVRESARAWTGWSLKDNRTYADRRTFMFRPRWHDDGIKTFLGRTGPWDGADVLRIILATPFAPAWLAGKLARWFVSSQPDQRLVDAMAQQLRETNYELRPVLATLFRSNAFYRPDVMYSQIKSPAEYVVGAIRHLRVQDVDWRRLEASLATMGQRLFFPPTVAGWPGGTRWINAGTVFNRIDVAAGLLTGRLGTADTSGFRSVDEIAVSLLGRPLPAPRQSALARATGGQPTDQAVHLVMSLPEYQVA
jgi:uncharacterized protein (DUF1800 family)